MSFGVVGKLLKCFSVSAAVWLAMPGVSWGQMRATFGTGISCASCCQSHHCPPAFKHCQEGPPNLHFHRGCPHPIANPCDLPHWGYFETCWTPFPFASDWSHCPVVPPAAFVNPSGQRSGFQTMPMPFAPGALSQPRTPMGTLPEELPRPTPIKQRQPGLQ